jgi:hypothetical protein
MQLARLSAVVLTSILACVGAEALAEQEGERRSRHAVRAIVGDWKTSTDGADTTIVVDGEAPLPAGVSDGPFSLGVLSEIPAFTAGTFQARFKLVAGKSDQTAGLVFDLRPSGEYLFVRYNTKDGNVALWRFANGERQRIVDGADHAQLPLGEWHQLTLTVAGRRITAVVNDTLRIEHELTAPVDGRVGFWTKRDSVTAFKDVRVQPAR